AHRGGPRRLPRPDAVGGRRPGPRLFADGPDLVAAARVLPCAGGRPAGGRARVHVDHVRRRAAPAPRAGAGPRGPRVARARRGRGGLPVRGRGGGHQGVRTVGGAARGRGAAGQRPRRGRGAPHQHDSLAARQLSGAPSLSRRVRNSAAATPTKLTAAGSSRLCPMAFENGPATSAGTAAPAPWIDVGSPLATRRPSIVAAIPAEPMTAPTCRRVL